LYRRGQFDQNGLNTQILLNLIEIVEVQQAIKAAMGRLIGRSMGVIRVKMGRSVEPFHRTALRGTVRYRRQTGW
jgi:hypothetical protein